MAQAAFISLFLVPLLSIVSCFYPMPNRVLLRISVAVAALESLAAAYLLYSVTRGAALSFGGEMFYIDLLSAFHLLIVAVVFLIASIYARGYFQHESSGDQSIGRTKMARYTMLWNGFLTVMMLVLVSNNLGMQWVALEGTTLVSAFLILFKGDRPSIEAMWKYLLICSVGIAFALVAVILVSVASTQIGPEHRQTLLWTTLQASARQLDPDVMLAAFIFALIGFGTKAGIAPMHTWLPDAHSQAPTPVSSVFSGVMLSCAFFGILRYLSIAEITVRNGEPRQLLLIFGLLSMAISAVFIMSQSDLKRLLAYSSIEHIGIICVGVGLGGVAVTAAMLHTVGHSLAKVVAFCGAGRIVQAYDTRQIGGIRGAVGACPLWGIGFFAAMAILIGVAPGMIFITELRMVLQAIGEAHLLVALIFIACCSLVFVTALRLMLGVGFGEPLSTVAKIRASWAERIMVVAVLVAIVIGGFWLPAPLKEMLARMATIIGGGA